MDKHYKQQYLGGSFAIVFFVMLAMGTFYMNLFADGDGGVLKEFAVHEKNIGQLVAMDWKLLFVHIWGTRMIQFLLLAMLVYYVGMKLVLYLCLAMFAWMLGMLIAAETMLLGAMGMLYGIAVCLPQGVFYGAIFAFLYLQVKYDNLQYDAWKVEKLKKMHWTRELLSGGIHRISVVMAKWVAVFALLTLGSLMEAYVNPHILLFCNQHIVSVINL